MTTRENPTPDDPASAHQLTVEALAASLATDPRRGLAGAEARARLARFGRNELEAAKPVPAWRRFLAQFRDVLVVLLLVATAISAGLWAYERETGLPYEALAILAVVLLNATMGFLQQARAERAVAALREMSAAEATVVRDGEHEQVPAAELVPGDLIVIGEGDTIPADARLVEVSALQASEAALTGESLPVMKSLAPVAADAALGDRANMVFTGTSASYGHGRALVTATGMRTEVGRIAGLLEASGGDTTPLQRELDRTGRILGAVVVAIAAVIIGTIIVLEEVRGFAAIVDVLILGVALAVAAVPEGLPAVVTAVLSLGVQRMAKRRAIVRHLAAVETLGSASVIASDKTGTLTRNEMTVRVVVTASGRVTLGGSGYAPEGAVRRADGGAIEGALRHELERALAAADRANNAVVREHDGRWQVHGDPTEGALLVAARKAGVLSEALDARLPRVGEVPFSSERKLMSTVHRDTERGERLVLFAKGAPDVLLGRCTCEVVGDRIEPLGAERRARILRDNEELAGQALRTLGVAVREVPPGAMERAGGAGPDASVEEDLAFAGLIGMIDPPRAEAAGAVARAKGAGIRPVVISGDHPRTASVIAQELGIAEDDRVLTGAQLQAMPDDERARAVREVSVYARVSPEHKLRIVDALQRGGAIVAMTGDGVNDAPALRAADIGIAMGIAGTDVSKEAADIVLADDDFATIVAAVEEGRAIFANIRKFLRFLLSSNIGEVLTMFLGVLLADRIGLSAAGGGAVVLPLLATQVLWINLVTDGAPALALGVDPADDGLMTRPPRPPREGVITGEMWRGIFLVGAVMAVSTLFVIDASLPGGLIAGERDLAYAQTMAFTSLMLAQLFNVLNARSDEASAFHRPFVNRWLWGAIGLALVLQFLVLYLPTLQRAFGTVALEPVDWLRCLGAASTVLVVREVDKAIRRAVRRHPDARSGRAGQRNQVIPIDTIGNSR